MENIMVFLKINDYVKWFKLVILTSLVALLSACPLLNNDDEGEEGEIVNVETTLEARAGADQTVLGGATVTLDGSSSQSTGSTISSYQWEQLSNLDIELANANSAIASFVAVTPTLTSSLTGVFQLTVTDTNGDTDTDIVDITINRPDQPLVAQADDQTVLEQTTVFLDASSSYDDDNIITDYLWVQTAGIDVALSNPTGPITEFLAPSLADDTSQQLSFLLTVTNDINLQDSLVVVVTVNAKANTLVADAGVDQVVTEGDEVVLDGSNSQDPNGNITSLSYKQVSGSLIAFDTMDTNTGKFTFTAPDVDVTEELVFELQVTNDNEQIATDLITISVNAAQASKSSWVYFGASDNGFAPHKLWRTDGTTANTMLVADTAITNNNENNPFITIDSYTYFSGYDPENGFELWKTDGTTTNTIMIASAPEDDYQNGASESAQPYLHQVLDGKLMYSAFTSSDSNFKYGSVLVLDPVSNSTTKIYDSLPAWASYSRANTIYNNKFYFSDSEFSPLQTQQYSSDGINPASAQISFNINAPAAGYSMLNGNLIFMALDQALYSYDGSTYSELKLFANDFTSFVLGDGWLTHEFDQHVYFAASDTNNTGLELWKTDGTTNGTVLVKDLDGTPSSSQPTSFQTVNNRLIFFVDETDGSSANGVWTSDGTEQGTIQLAGVDVLEQVSWYEGVDDAKPVTIDALGLTFFVAETANEGIELWATDGTVNGTYMVKDILVGSQSSYPALLRDGGDILIFSAIDEETGCASLWKSDGSNAGTVKIKDIIAEGEFCIGNSTFYPLAG